MRMSVTLGVVVGRWLFFLLFDRFNSGVKNVGIVEKPNLGLLFHSQCVNQANILSSVLHLDCQGHLLWFTHMKIESRVLE
mmetsp:Transcript_2644/g.5697  ORF Transcript_2644/g.5697 Transcript_2644/m.5697 type:complete len:80 (-) Transcript_2644:142-381(-)